MASPAVLVANNLNKSSSCTFNFHDLFKLLALPMEWDFGLKNKSQLFLCFWLVVVDIVAACFLD